MPMTRAHVYVHGRVQGVFFRASTRDMARVFGVKGWVKNCVDGGVEAVFEGKKDAVDKMVTWCRKGPVVAFVENIDVCWEEYSDEFDEFSVVY
ncbi:MAG: acylphosphatase [Candidatus Brocadia sinica]|uniref:Acylphosphatase n=2 Tax=Candidatus Brocadiaceae TaxID=1127830 RepID=A0ABQ0JSN6_9BACT|nr:MAG: acylphosphatase [Candidatus Brocadia sinica]NOG43323.1 acylphosphatase [Planctomycetota bacterium]GAN31735.1 acylphosphatase muscle type isozyme [Candidatus Brocadia sinica JPN1]NUO06382.1 acylphosphatase [Candidatus Brocadia sinica]GIK12559.1 MAG: acylphosphatase [Candidatus Brocadia sinica]